MKAIVACSAIFLLACSVHAWVFPKHAIEKAASVASLAFAIGTAPLPSAAFDFTGAYADPKHPNCLRDIVTFGTVASVSGTDGDPGCPADGSGKEWELVGKVEGTRILIDFSPKGGPADLEGEWDSTAPAGIQWPDGNKWTMKD